MVAQNLIPVGYQSKEARMFFLKQRADKVSDFIHGLRSRKGEVYLKIISEISGIESLVTLQSFLLQVSLYSKKYSDLQILEILEVHRGYQALSDYYRDKSYVDIAKYLKEIKQLFELCKE